MRNPTIELARYIFAFLVVFIHVRLDHGGTVLMPLARCAVPFFYLVSGYFLGKKQDSSTKLKIAAKKWFLMWAKYIFIFLMLGITIDVYCGNPIHPSFSDLISFFRSGTCPFIDAHDVNGKEYGILTLWFLYCGGLAFLFLYFLRKWWRTKTMIWIVCLLQMIFVYLKYMRVCNWSFFYASVPYIYYGILLGRSNISPNKCKVWGVCSLILWLLGIIEYKINSEVVFVCIPLSLSLFLLILSPQVELMLKKVLPPPMLQSLSNANGITLDIYIWHRLVWLILMLLGANLYGIDAIIVFVITFVLSLIFRNLIRVVRKKFTNKALKF